MRGRKSSVFSNEITQGAMIMFTLEQGYSSIKEVIEEKKSDLTRIVESKLDNACEIAILIITVLYAK